MAELAAPTAAFKRTIAPGKCTGWISFTLTEDPPPEFEDWCRSHPVVRTVEGPDTHSSRPARSYLLFLIDFDDDRQSQRAIRSFIKVAGIYLDCQFAIDDQGVHYPDRRRSDGDLRLANWLLGLDSNTVLAPTGNTTPRLDNRDLDRWRQQQRRWRWHAVVLRFSWLSKLRRRRK